MTEQADDVRDIHLVLDRSAIQSYGRGHVHVGEVITEIETDDVIVGIPAAALLDAHAGFLSDKLARARLDVLVQLPGVETLNLTADSAREAADMMPFADDDLARSHAMWAALEYSAMYLTAEPEESARVVAEDRIIVVPAEDA